MLKDRIERDFTFHSGVPTSKYHEVRASAKLLAEYLAENVPDCHELDIALDKLNEVVMWANAGIARHHGFPTKFARQMRELLDDRL